MKEETLEELQARPTETMEELQSKMTPAALELVDNMTADIVSKSKTTKQADRHFNKRNRKAWDRMNRPSRVAKVEKNMERLLNFFSFKGYKTDEQL